VVSRREIPGNVGRNFPSNGPVSDEEYPYDRLKGLPVAVVHGEPNAGTSGEAALRMVQHAKEHGVEVLWLSVPEADHLIAWTKVVRQVFNFFGQHQKSSSPATPLA
jgi:hypothetical protein